MKLNKRTCKHCGDIFQKEKPLQYCCSVKCDNEYKKDKKKPVKPINKISVKRKKENNLYLCIRKQFLKDNPLCAVTGNKATEVHHTYCGANRSKYFLYPDTWLAVCREGHNWIHDNPIEAREKGFLK